MNDDALPPGDAARDRVRDWFTRHAGNYARDASQRSGHDLLRLVELLAPESSARVLDVGCAAGNTAVALAPRVAEVTGLDLTEAMRPLFEGRCLEAGVTNARFTTGDVEALPFPDDSFDAVVCRRAAHHFPDPGAAVAEMARVLRPGGRLGIADMTAPDAPPAADLFNGLERARDPSHLRALPPAEWRALLDGSGLRLLSLEVIPDRIPWVSWLSPETPGSAADGAARALLGEAPAAHRGPVVEEGADGLHFLKARLVAVAERTAPTPP